MTPTPSTLQAIFEPVKLSEKSMKLALEWIVSEDTGLSSKTIWSMMMNGKAPERQHAPCDNGDFGRCYRLLKLIPEFEQNLERMATIKRRCTVNGGPQCGGWIEEDTWAVFVREYLKLCELYLSENYRDFYYYWKEVIKTEN